MRNLLIAAALAVFIPSIAAAEDAAAGFVNNAGGMTIITGRNQYCGARQMMDGYAYNKEGKSVRMCWLYVNQQVRAVFEDGDSYIYPATIFQSLDKEPELNFNQP